MQEESRNVMVPIKDLLTQGVAHNGCNFPEEEFDILRQYFIACLNLGYIEPKDLASMVNKLCYNIKFIVPNYNGTNNLDYYVIKNKVLYICGGLKETNNNLYELNMYKAATEAIFDMNGEYFGSELAISHMVAEKVFNMHTNESRLILPKLNNEMIGNVKHSLRSGYSNYDLIITLFKQFLISQNLNETPTIKDMFKRGFNSVVQEHFMDENEQLVLNVLNKIAQLDVERKRTNKPDEKENLFIEKYQTLVNNLFKNHNQYYFAFCALLTQDELREKFLKAANINLGGDLDE